MVELAFQRPLYLWFLLSILLLILIHFYTLKRARRQALKFANFEAILKITGGRALSKSLGLLTIRVVALAFAILAVAGTTVWYSGQTSGGSFVVALDASSSMRADDFPPTRLDAAKQAALRFVDSVGQQTHIGVLSFSGTVFVDQALVGTPAEVKRAINAVQTRTTGGTDLGAAIIQGVNMLQEEPKGRALILLTDGQSNVGVPLQEAVDYANQFRVTIHTIGIGTEAGGKIEGVDLTFLLDEAALQLIAAATGGAFFKVGDLPAMERAYQDIAALTEQKLAVDLSPLLMLMAVVLLFFEWVLMNTIYRVLP